MTTMAESFDEENSHEIRKTQIGRYEYALLLECGKYYVRCSDVERAGVQQLHGPLSEEEGHAFIDERVQRVEDLRRD
jgi:hypothetical protein